MANPVQEVDNVAKMDVKSCIIGCCINRSYSITVGFVGRYHRKTYWEQRDERLASGLN